MTTATQVPSTLFAASTESILHRFTFKKLLSIHLFTGSQEKDIAKRLRSIVYAATINPPLRAPDGDTLIREVAIKYQPIFAESDAELIRHELLMNHVLTTATTESVRTSVPERMHTPDDVFAAEDLQANMLSSTCTNIVRMFHWRAETSDFLRDALFSVPPDQALATHAAWKDQHRTAISQDLAAQLRAELDPGVDPLSSVFRMNTPSVVMILELAEMSLLDLLTQNADTAGSEYINDAFLKPSLTQVLCTLYYLGVWRFSHQDLNLGNILIKKRSAQNSVRHVYYVLNANETVVQPTADTKNYMFMLSDFGFSYAKFANGRGGAVGEYDPPYNRFPSLSERLRYAPRFDMTVLGLSLVYFLLFLYEKNATHVSATKQTFQLGLRLLDQCDHDDVKRITAKLRPLTAFSASVLTEARTALQKVNLFGPLAQKCIPSALSDENQLYDVIKSANAVSITQDILNLAAFKTKCGDMTLRPLLKPKQRFKPEENQGTKVTYSAP